MSDSTNSHVERKILIGGPMVNMPSSALLAEGRSQKHSSSYISRQTQDQKTGVRREEEDLSSSLARAPSCLEDENRRRAILKRDVDASERFCFNRRNGFSFGKVIDHGSDVKEEIETLDSENLRRISPKYKKSVKEAKRVIKSCFKDRFGSGRELIGTREVQAKNPFIESSYGYFMRLLESIVPKLDLQDFIEETDVLVANKQSEEGVYVGKFYSLDSVKTTTDGILRNKACEKISRLADQGEEGIFVGSDGKEHFRKLAEASSEEIGLLWNLFFILNFSDKESSRGTRDHSNILFSIFKRRVDSFRESVILKEEMIKKEKTNIQELEEVIKNYSLKGDKENEFIDGKSVEKRIKECKDTIAFKNENIKKLRVGLEFILYDLECALNAEAFCRVIFRIADVFVECDSFRSSHRGKVKSNIDYAVNLMFLDSQCDIKKISESIKIGIAFAINDEYRRLRLKDSEAIKEDEKKEKTGGFLKKEEKVEAQLRRSRYLDERMQEAKITDPSNELIIRFMKIMRERTRNKNNFCVKPTDLVDEKRFGEAIESGLFYSDDFAPVMVLCPSPESKHKSQFTKGRCDLYKKDNKGRTFVLKSMNAILPVYKSNAPGEKPYLQGPKHVSVYFDYDKELVKILDARNKSLACVKFCPTSFRSFPDDHIEKCKKELEEKEKKAKTDNQRLELSLVSNIDLLKDLAERSLTVEEVVGYLAPYASSLTYVYEKYIEKPDYYGDDEEQTFSKQREQGIQRKSLDRSWSLTRSASEGSSDLSYECSDQENIPWYKDGIGKTKKVFGNAVGLVVEKFRSDVSALNPFELDHQTQREDEDVEKRSVMTQYPCVESRQLLSSAEVSSYKDKIYCLKPEHGDHSLEIEKATIDSICKVLIMREGPKCAETFMRMFSVKTPSKYSSQDKVDEDCSTVFDQHKDFEHQDDGESASTSFSQREMYLQDEDYEAYEGMESLA